MTAVEFRKSLNAIDRMDGRTTVTVLGRRAEGFGPKELSDLLAGVMEKFSLPRGYSWSEQSVSQETAAQIAELVQAGALSVVLVFLLMGVLFESVVLPLSILVTILFAGLGGMWALKWFHGSIDPMAITGLILLAGVVVNNGIVLLDCIERLRRDGHSREAAIRDGIKIRLLPIVMTAMTTIVGLLPMAIFGENAGQGVNYVSLSITVVGGLALCTLCTAPAVSWAYTILDDLRGWLQGCAASSSAAPVAPRSE
jgi:HAE1 family hydrophobic/amphiphilic exporter-1